MKKYAALGCVGLVLLLLLIVGVGGCSTYNSLVTRSTKVDESWAQVQNVYQRRADLIPNLVATVSGAADFEKSTITQVTEARASVGRVQIDASKAPADAARLEEFQKAQGQLSTALSRLLVVAERYPDLKATAAFRDLQAQLEGTENRITVERQKFNEAVQAYNTDIRKFPAVLLAGALGFQSKPYFGAKEGADTPPKVDFSKPAPPRP
ncbi:MAG TPA: LemA family protein [Verrucomicrobiae bacterium]|nr:LemA family protein [Verrucomicrobiae bacterium]